MCFTESKKRTLKDNTVLTNCLPECNGIYYKTQVVEKKSLVNNTKYHRNKTNKKDNEIAKDDTKLRETILKYLSGFDYVSNIYYLRIFLQGFMKFFGLLTFE